MGGGSQKSPRFLAQCVTALQEMRLLERSKRWPCASWLTDWKMETTSRNWPARSFQYRREFVAFHQGPESPQGPRENRLGRITADWLSQSATPNRLAQLRLCLS